MDNKSDAASSNQPNYFDFAQAYPAEDAERPSKNNALVLSTIGDESLTSEAVNTVLKNERALGIKNQGSHLNAPFA